MVDFTKYTTPFDNYDGEDLSEFIGNEWKLNHECGCEETCAFCECKENQ